MRKLRRRVRSARLPVLTTRTFLVVLLVGLLVAAGGLVGVFTTTAPATVTADAPILAAPETTTTTTEAPTTTTTEAPPETTTTVAPRPARAAAEPKPATPPKNAYAPEPIVEIGTIEIPKIGLSHRIMHGITMRNIDLGPSHWPGTAMPGEVGNAVFAGHRVTKTHPFRNIDQLEPGDRVYFTIDGQRTTYEMTESEIVPPTALRIADQTDTPTATLFACHPPGSARFRYVVKLVLVSEGPEGTS